MKILAANSMIPGCREIIGDFLFQQRLWPQPGAHVQPGRPCLNLNLHGC